MIMEPVVQRVDAKLQQDKPLSEQVAAGVQHNEEEKKVEVDQPPMFEASDEQGLKRGILGDLGPSQKKIKAESGLEPSKDVSPRETKNAQERAHANEDDGKNVITPKVETNESQSMPTDYYSNGIHVQHPQQQFPPPAPLQQPFQHQHFQPYHNYMQQPPPPSQQYSAQQPPLQQYSGQQTTQNHQQYGEQQPTQQPSQQYSGPQQSQQQQPPQQQYGGQQPTTQQSFGGAFGQQQHPNQYPQSPHPQHYQMHNLQQDYMSHAHQQQPQQQQMQHFTNPHQQLSQQSLQQQQQQQQQQPPYPLPQFGGVTITRNEPKPDNSYDVKAKLKEMGEISVETVKKTDKKKDNDSEVTPPKKPDEEANTVVERKGNMRKNIREVMDETKLDESTLAAQRQEVERLRRVQEQQRLIRDLQRQANQDRVMSLLQGNEFPLEGQEGPSSTKIGSTVLVRLPNGQVKPSAKVIRKPLDLLHTSKSPSTTIDISPSSIIGQTNLTPSVSIAPVPKRFEPPILDESDEERDPLAPSPIPDSHNEPVDVIDLSSDSDDDCIVVSETENDPEEDEDPTNSGMHTNDEFNQPNEEGKVVINVGHADDEPDVYVAPQISRIIKPHQIGGIRFLYDNIIESTKMYDTSTGFGCILAHSMGLGKTLQVVTFSDTFLRHTSAKTILCIMPINTLQNWLAEFNMWLPTEEDAKNSPLLVHGEVRPRNFNLHVLNDSHKTLAARAKVIHNWNTSGGVLLIGYEQYRLLSLKRCPKSRSKKAQQRLNDDDKNKHLFDEVHEALVTPGPDLVVCDEGHRIKNSHASISQALKQMRTKRRVVLTGYPLQNNLMEYWCMVDFVRPNYLGTKTEFCNMFERPIQNGQCIDSTENDIKLMRYRAHVLHSLLLGFVQRRSHRVLQTALPQKEEYVLLVRMTDFQRTLYETFMNEVVRTQTVPNPLKAFAVCCKIWNHPDVLYYYLKKQEKGGAVDIDLEEVTTVATPAVNSKVAKPRVKKQGKKEKPAASVTPYNSNNSTAENASATTGAAPTTTQNANPTPGNVSSQPNLNNPSNNFNPAQNHYAPNPQSMMPNTNNYPTPNYNAQSSQMNNYPGNSNPMAGDYRASFNQARPPTQYGATSSNQYMSAPGGYANQSNNYPMNNDARTAYPPREPHYNPNAYNTHMHMQPQHTHPHGHPTQPHHPHQQHSYQNNPNNYPNPYPHAHNQQGPTSGPGPGPGPSNQYNAMQPYNSNQSGYQNYQHGYPNYQNQNYWNSPQQQQPYQQQEVKTEPYYNNCMPYDSNNQWIKQEDVKVKQEVDTKPKINILSDICISNTFDGRGPVAPEKKINILSDIKLEPKSESIDISDDVKKESSQDDQKKNDSLDIKVEKTDLDDDVKLLSPVKVAKEDTGIPYDWAIELLKDYVPGFIENSAKMEILFSIVRESLALGDRLLVFSQSLITLDLVEQFLQMNIVPGDTVKWAKNTSYYRLDGSTTALEREKLINEFNSNSKVYLFLVSTRAGSLGINLIGANRVVVLDASWNPCHDTQAVCRVYRYGQRKPCFVYRLVVDNCLEKKIYDRQINKQGMSDRVVDECNPDAHLTMKDVTTLCWDDDRETEEKDWSYCKDKYIDVVLQKVLAKHGKSFNKEPFQHESLLIDRKDKQLSSLEKRMAKRGYEREKQAARQPNYSAGTGVRHRPVASVRPMQQAGEPRLSKWIPAEHWQRQGMTAQEMTLPLDVVIPTVQPDKGKIVLKAGQKVLILKSPKGVYMQLESGKIVSIKTAIKVRGKVDEDSSNSTTPPSQPSPSPPPNIPLTIKHSPSVSVTTTPPKRAVKPFVPTPRLNIRGRAPIPPRLTQRPMKKVQMNKALPAAEEHAISSGDDEPADDKRLNFPHRDGMPKQSSVRRDAPPHRDVSMRDVRPVRHMANQPHFNNHTKLSGNKGTSALQQLEKSTTAIISESKQPFQETLNSITKSYPDDETKPVNSQPITIDDEPEEKTSHQPQRASQPTHPHPQTSTKPNIPPTSEYANQYGSYYGYNMQPYSAHPHPPQPPIHPYGGYAAQTAPPSYDMSAYPPQSTQPHQAQHTPHAPSTIQQPTSHPPQQPPAQNSQQQQTSHVQQTSQGQSYNYGGYPPHIYSTPPQYPSQPYEYPAHAPPPPASQPQTQTQPMYSTPYSYQQYPPPGPAAPQPVYSTAPNPSVYSTDYQYASAQDANAPPYYPPQT